ncbi:hypothetical protein CBL_06934 [Carabus blaptoides fortunei]
MALQNGILLPIVYDGSIQWDQWLVLYEVAAEMNGWRDDPDKMANMLIFSLRGHALSLCLTLEETVRKDYVALKDKLNEILCPEDSLDMLIAQLEQRKRKPEESLVDLKIDVHKLVCKVYPGMDAASLEKHARVAFLKSITGTSYGEKTIDAQPQTLDEALSKAQFFEQREEQQKPRLIQQRTSYNNNDNESVMSDESVADWRKGKKKKNKCYKCGEYGHLRSNCNR